MVRYVMDGWMDGMVCGKGFFSLYSRVTCLFRYVMDNNN